MGKQGPYFFFRGANSCLIYAGVWSKFLVTFKV